MPLSMRLSAPAIARFAPAFAGFAFGFALAAPAFADTSVETYAQATIDKGVAILKDASLKDKARDDALRAFLDSALDLKRIALFTLGAAAKSASPTDLESYTQAFKTFALTGYLSRVGAYGGQSLKVASAVARAPGDYIVTVNVVDPAAPKSAPADSAQFRVVSETGGGFAVVDASVQGIWFELAQRDDVQGFLAQNGGSVAKLIDHLKQMTAQLAPAH
jgi:phospholipid transport system substrate-binding protein